MRDTFPIEIAGLRRDLPVVPLGDGSISIAFLKLYGDRQLIEAVTDELSRRLDPATEVLVGPESGGILLTHLLAAKTDRPYAIARKKRRPHMVNPLHVSVSTIASSDEQELWLDDADSALLAGSTVTIVDEVISSGATLQAVRTLVHQAGGDVAQALAAATEGDTQHETPVHALANLPVFTLTKPA